MEALSNNTVPSSWNELPPLPDRAIPEIDIDWPRADVPAPGKHGRFLANGWRTVVGALGRTFISIGLLLFAFVAYLLWGTNIKAAQYQNDLNKQFAQIIAGAPATTTTPPTTDAPVPTTGQLQPGSTVATTLAPAPSTSAAPAPIAKPDPGSPFAQLDIPSIGIEGMTIVSGVSVDDLKKGPGHFRTTPMPGQLGNAALAGHRTTWGAPFSNIDKLNPGDEIRVTNARSEQFVYRVVGQKIVPPTDVSVLGPTEQPSLTLVSCHPKLSAANRIIVTAVLDVGASTGVVTDPPPPTRAEPTPTTLPDEPGVTTTSATQPGETTAATVAVTRPADELAAADDQVDETFQQGWFADKDAWPQVILWGAILANLSLIAFAISRKTGRAWVGYAVGAVPFLFALYFFFENANRLMPPNL